MRQHKMTFIFLSVHSKADLFVLRSNSVSDLGQVQFLSGCDALNSLTLDGNPLACEALQCSSDDTPPINRPSSSVLGSYIILSNRNAARLAQTLQTIERTFSNCCRTSSCLTTNPILLRLENHSCAWWHVASSFQPHRARSASPRLMRLRRRQRNLIKKPNLYTRASNMLAWVLTRPFLTGDIISTCTRTGRNREGSRTRILSHSFQRAPLRVHSETQLANLREFDAKDPYR